VKRLALALLADVSNAFGDAVKEEQEVLADVADVVIEAYAIESALLRTEKLGTTGGPDRSAVAVDIARCYAADAAERVARWARQISRALPRRSEGLAGLAAEVATFDAVDGVAARRRIADAVVAAGRQPF
jgi:hypothetical protein